MTKQQTQGKGTEVKARLDKKYKEEVAKIIKEDEDLINNLEPNLSRACTYGLPLGNLEEGTTTVTAYKAKTRDEEIAKILEDNKKYITQAPLGYVYEDEMTNVLGLSEVKVQGKAVSLQSILYANKKMITRPKKKDKTKMFGPYTKAQVMNNVRLMQIYLPKEYEAYTFGVMQNAVDVNRSCLTGYALGGRQGFRR